MKNLLQIVFPLIIACALVMFSGSPASEQSNHSGREKGLSNQLSLLNAVSDSTLYPTEDGYIDRQGKIVLKLPPNTYIPRGFSEGLAAVRMPHRSIKDEDGLGYIDRTGKIVIPPKFIDVKELDGAETFSEGLAAFAIDRGDKYVYGYTDRTGRMVIPARFAAAGSFIHGIALVQIDDHGTVRFAFINKQGKIIFEHPQAYEAYPFSEGLAAVKIDGKWGFINSLGQFAISPQFVNAPLYLRFSEGLAPVQSIDRDTCNCNEKHECIYTENKYGYIDIKGKFQIEPKFDEAKPFSEGLAAVRVGNETNGKWGFIDRTGAFVIPPQFEDTAFGSREFHEGLAAINVPDATPGNGYTGYIDRAGNFVIPPQFNQLAGHFQDGLAEAHTAFEKPKDQQSDFPYQGGKYGYIDRQGNFVWEKKYP